MTLTNWKLVGKDGSQNVHATVVAETLEEAVKLVTKVCWGFKLTQSLNMGHVRAEVTSLRKT